ncbi:hypothetical protein KI387_037332 [Taxus chinensis]|uniref:Uncharacterized protein n=1 Tax=Taxus chinensis TaxID=29808 RepID=A0AA38FS85_TAXCH|nr:hypothetical protein KI387_037332 [Taxus chinensis]
MIVLVISGSEYSKLWGVLLTAIGPRHENSEFETPHTPVHVYGDLRVKCVGKGDGAVENSRVLLLTDFCDYNVFFNVHYNPPKCGCTMTASPAIEPFRNLAWNFFEAQEVGNGNALSEGLAMDGSVDLKGKPVLRSRTGRWKACSFVVGYEVFERMAFYGIASNLVNYLTSKLHEGTVTSARNVNNWSGAIWITPVFGAYIADTHWGRYWTFIIFSFIYILGMILLTLAVSLQALRPHECPKNVTVCEKASTLHVGFFYFALYTLAIGTGGTKPNISTIGADQFDEFDPKEKVQKVSFFNWWLFSVFFGSLFAQTFLIYIQENVGFTVGYAVPTGGLIISVAIFLVGTPFYRHKLQNGNPFARIVQVIVAAVRKCKVKVPADPNELHELDPKDYVAKGRFPISKTPFLRFLDRAAAKDGRTNPWSLCPVTQVEETKLMIKLLPIWVVMLIPSTIIAQVNTLFIKQGNRLERNMGSHFKIPSGSLTAFVTMSMLVTIVVYDRVLVKLFRRFTGNSRGITILQRMGIGLVIHVIIMVVAAIIEEQRIRVVKAHGLEGDGKAVAPLTVFILLPQLILMGVADAFVDAGKFEFFYDQAPESMQSIGTSLFASTLGIGNFISSSLLTTVDKITGKKGHTGWVLDNLNASRLYYYYALLAVLSFFNFLAFLIVSWKYVYKRETSKAFGSSHTSTVASIVKAPEHESQQQRKLEDFVASSPPDDGSFLSSVTPMRVVSLAENKSSDDSNENYNGRHNFNFSLNPSLGIVVIGLLVFFFLDALFFVLTCRHTTLATRGLERMPIESFPVFNYNLIKGEKSHAKGSECAVHRHVTPLAHDMLGLPNQSSTRGGIEPWTKKI